ncbi:TolB family protein [Caenimonas sp. SL110]|uniref:TolB family protein n=1 Tax=Caenimonas sp. SL110 TaxID=1450524 RepID=UPI0009E51DC5|nr:TolB family protein [Caenimonas sp. SL110]
MMKILNLTIRTMAASLALAATLAFASPDKVGVIATSPSPSPLGTEIVFSADFDGPSRLWAVRFDGTGLRRVTSAAQSNPRVLHSDPVWSPDGRTIAYTVVDGEKSDIWITLPNGAALAKLTSNGARNWKPAWSPDGSKIAFVSDMHGTYDIWLMNANGSQQQQLTSLPQQEHGPSFSPAGNEIVFSVTDRETARLMTIKTDGTSLKAITSTGFFDWDPDWGSSGIVFSTSRDERLQGHLLWMVQPDGSGLRKLPASYGYDPMWTKTGQIVVTEEPVKSKAMASIAIQNADGSGRRTLVDVQGYTAAVDIRPGKSTNNINPRSRGKVKVAILSTSTFDAPKLVKQSTLTFGRTGSEPSLNQCMRARDVNNDGIADLVCRFNLSATGFRSGDPVGIVRFDNREGVPYEGRDSVVIVPQDDPEDFED